MPGPAIAGIAGSVANGVIGEREAKRAGARQSAAADAQIAETRRQFDTIQGLLRPYVSGGNVALQAQLDLMGIGGGGGAAPTIEAFSVGGMPGTAGAGAGGAMGGFANDFAMRMAGVPVPRTGGTPGIPGMQRYRVNGQEFNTYEDAQAYANANRSGGMSADDAQRAAIDRLANGENFRALQAQGEYGLMANAAATGGLRGGNTQAALAQFRPQMLQSLIDRQLANLGGVAANGQNAAGMTGQAAMNTAGMVNQALGDRGAAQAGAGLGGARAWQNAGAGVLNTLGSMAGPVTPGGGLWQRFAF